MRSLNLILKEIVDVFGVASLAQRMGHTEEQINAWCHQPLEWPSVLEATRYRLVYLVESILRELRFSTQDMREYLLSPRGRLNNQSVCDFLMTSVDLKVAERTLLEDVTSFIFRQHPGLGKRR